MAEREELQKRYSYHEMASKVHRADKGSRYREGAHVGGRGREGDATGEVEPLRVTGDKSNLGGARMGDRVVTGKKGSSNNKEDNGDERRRKKRRSQKDNDEMGNNSQKKSKIMSSGGAGAAARSVLDDGYNVSGYRPTTEQSAQAYEQLLALVCQPGLLGHQGPSVLRDAVQMLLEELFDEGKTDPQRHQAISQLLTGKDSKQPGGLGAEQFTQMVRMGKQLDDYHRQNKGEGGNGDGNDDDDDDNHEVDQEQGVAVMFEDSEEDNSDGGGGSDSDDAVHNRVVLDLSSSSDSEDDDVGGGDDGDNEKAKRRRRRRRQDSDSDGDNSSIDNDDEEVLVQGNSFDEQSPSKAGGGGGSSSKGAGRTKVRTLSVHEIDAHYLQRLLGHSSAFENQDASVVAQKAKQVLERIRLGGERNDDDDDDDNNNNSIINNAESDSRACENRLLVLLGFELFDTIKLILHNRVRIWGTVSLKQNAGNASRNQRERDRIEAILKQEQSGQGQQILNEYYGNAATGAGASTATKRDKVKQEGGEVSKALDSIGSNLGIKKEDADKMEVDGVVVSDNDNNNDLDQATELDLDQLAFEDGAHTNTNNFTSGGNKKMCELPDTSWRAMKKGYEEVHVPGKRNIIPKGEKLIPIANLPSWTHAAFKGMTTLNRVQSKICSVALETSENVLLCAPTSAGKTNVAMLTILNILGQYRREPTPEELEPEDDEAININEHGVFDRSAFKIIYVAPMKALVQEVVKNFSERLSPYGVTVRELSGDASLTRQQIAETQMIVTTPEKWDIVTRQGEGRAFTQLVKLVIIDEIHLLHDERGPVLESIVARVIRQVETTAEPIRLVGLSATLPNYEDVATFLRVKPDKGLFFFDQSYRPVPLQMQYIGITERNAFKRIQLQNQICYEKCVDQRKNGRQQVLIFVHSRAETGKTAKALRDFANSNQETNLFVRDGSATSEILREEAEAAKHPDLKDVLPHGFGIHHAGMAREDRELVEELFADRHIAVLCTTATLAWGVNLPARAVIIRGTQIYNPEKGKWCELSPLDILQMLGRAGRPQYDKEGEGIIVTQHSELQYYLSLTNQQLPVESQLIKTLPDHLNAEMVLGTVQSLADAVEWLSYTFLYVRMLQNPEAYGLDSAMVNTEDPALRRRRRDLAHTAAGLLEASHLARYDRKSGALQSTPLGRVASQYYINHASMAAYTRHMRPNMSDIELLRLFAVSGEFAHVTVREEEKLELTKLSGRVPIPVKESPNETSAKINMLLQAYISRLKLDGFALVADMAFIQQSSARIMRALFEIALRRRWASLAKLCLDMSNMVAYRIWRSQSPLRQFKNVPDIVSRKLERKTDIEWDRYPDLTASDLGELVGVPKMGRVLQKLVHQFPRLELSAQIQPITRSMIRVELSLVPAFQFDVNIHGYVQLFHVFVEDVNGETILHHETFALKSRSNEEEHVLVFSVPIMEPLPPAYFIRVMSDRWLHSTSVLPISLSTMILPAKFPPPTELLDLQPLLPTALGEPALTKLFANTYKEFNPIQTQTFHALFKTDKNCLVCAASGSGKTVCAEFAILRMLTTNAGGKCVYVAPMDSIADPVFEHLESLFRSLLPKGAVVRLTGETVPDLKLLAEGKIIVCSIAQWDMLSRRWRQRKGVQTVSLIIFDELHFLGGNMGPTLEVVISRMRYLSNQLKQPESKNELRIVGLSASLANARDVAEWMGVPSKSLFNFSPKSRPLPLEIYFQSFDQSNYAGRLMAMAKPVYSAVTRHFGGKSAIIYVPSRRQAQLTAIDLMTYQENQDERLFLGTNTTEEEISKYASQLREVSLQQVIKSGIGFVHGGMSAKDWDLVVELYRRGHIRVLVCPADLCWRLRCVAVLVVIMGTESYDGREGRHVDYPVVDLLHMMGRHETKESGKCVILCHAPKKEYLKKLLYNPLPVESHLDSYLHDPLNAEIVTKGVTSMQDAIDYLTWSFLYRRLSKNPTYYGLRGTTNVILSEHLSEMIETVVGDLEESKCCRVSEDGAISPLNLGMIAAYYYIQYRTIELMASSVTAKTKIRGILEILSASWEFSSLALRYGEDKTLKTLARTLLHKPPDNATYDSNTKALILLQCHFSRTSLPTDLRADQKLVLKEAVNLIQAIVDVISSNGWLKPALAAMELSQMVVQGLWNKDHALKQIPHFTEEIIGRCLAYKGEEPIEGVFDILTLDDDVRNDLLRLPDEKMADVAIFCNNYPSIEISFDVLDAEDVTAGDPVQIKVELEREVDEEELNEDELADLGKVSCPLFPFEKKEGWWVVVCDTSTNSLLSIKRVSLRQKQKVMLEFLAPEDAGDYDLTLFCMSDSYLGCDQQYSIPLSVAVAESDDDDGDDDDDSKSNDSKEE